MANENHIDLLRQGAEHLNWVQKRQPVKLDLSSAVLMDFDLRNMNLSHANLQYTRLGNCKMQNAKLVGADLSNANLEGAFLTGADLSCTDFTGSILVGAHLLDVTISKNTILNCNLQQAKFSAELLRQANIAGADLSHHDLQNIDLSNRDLHQTNFNSAMLDGAQFVNSNMTDAHLQSSFFRRANFEGAILERASLSHATLVEANLIGASLRRADLTWADLSHAEVQRADFYEATLTKANFDSVKGIFHARNLQTTRLEGDTRYFDRVRREWPERLVDWERIRIFGRLPLFGASYTVLIVIQVFLYALEIYNEKISALRAWADSSGLSSHVAEAILGRLHQEPIPSKWPVLFGSTIALAIASTMYVFACPSRVTTFSRDEWCDGHGHSLLHYWAEAWKWRHARIVCFTTYLVGGFAALYVLLSKLCGTAIVLFGWPPACF